MRRGRNLGHNRDFLIDRKLVVISIRPSQTANGGRGCNKACRFFY